MRHVTRMIRESCHTNEKDVPDEATQCCDICIFICTVCVHACVCMRDGEGWHTAHTHTSAHTHKCHKYYLYLCVCAVRVRIYIHMERVRESPSWLPFSLPFCFPPLSLPSCQQEDLSSSLSFLSPFLALSRGGGLGSRPKKMYGKRLGDGVEYHLMSPTPRC